MAIVQADASQIPGILAEFATTYERTITESNERLEMAMRRGIPSDKRAEIHFYFESAPHVVRWVKGANRPMGGFRGIQWEVENLDWGRGIEWHANDADDDLTGSLVTRARDLALSFGILDERVFFQIITAGADNDLLPAIPNSPDGAALYNATDGSGAARFGVTGGNVVSAGAFVATADDVQGDYFTGLSRGRSFQDTDGQPMIPEDQLESNVLVVYNTANEKAFKEAFDQRIHQSAGGGAGVSALIIDSAFGVRTWPTSRIGDDDWFMFFGAMRHRSIFSQSRQEPREVVTTMDNDSEAKRTKIEGIGYDSRRGYSVSAAFQTVHINHS